MVRHLHFLSSLSLMIPYINSIDVSFNIHLRAFCHSLNLTYLSHWRSILDACFAFSLTSSKLSHRLTTIQYSFGTFSITIRQAGMYTADDYQWTERQINLTLDLHLVSIISISYLPIVFAHKLQMLFQFLIELIIFSNCTHLFSDINVNSLQSQIIFCFDTLFRSARVLH